MKRKAFTLVELMGVLIIIGLLCLIIIPVIANILKSEKEKQYERQITTITLAAKNLVSDNLAIVPKADGEYMYIMVGQLKSLGYLEDNLVNPVTEKAITDCARVKITKVDNSYEYVYDQATENNLGCNLGTEDIHITEPEKTYIKKGETVSYIVSIKQDLTQGISEYEIDQRKIVLTGTTDSTIGIIEGTGIYKIVIKAGQKEGQVGIKLESGSILKNKKEDVIGTSGLDVSKKVTIDNTAPQIVFGTDGNSSWAKSANSTITVTDNLSGGVTNSYKYVYTTNVNTPPSTSFTSGSSYSKTAVTGDYYLIAKACDQAGNCNTKTSNVFKLDNTGPTLLSMTNEHSSTWSTEEYYTQHTGKDDHSGIKYWQYAIGNGSYVTESNTASNTYNAYWVQDRNSKVKIRACDYLDNCSTPQETTIKIDKTAPVITLGTDGNSNWSKSANSTITVTDNLSGGVTSSYKYVYTTNVNTPPSTSFTSGSSYSERAGTGNYYLIAKACDQAGNCNTKTSNVFKLDNTGPTLLSMTNEHSSTWSKEAYYTKHTGKDDQSGIKYWQYAIEKGSYVTELNTASNTYNAHWKQDINSKVKIRACDYLDNCSTPQETTIKIDKTAPVITLGTDGNSNWSKSANSTITVTDNLSGGVTNSYKYVYTTNVNTTPSTSFTSGSSYSKTAVTGDYYLIAKACDQAGNCNTKTSNVFKLDNTGPTLLSMTNEHSSTWSKEAYYTKHTGKDDHSGIKYWQYAIENGSYVTESNTASNTYNAYWVQDRNSTVKIRACDYLDNCSTPQETTIKIDKTAPVITLGTDGNSNWSKSANSTITVTDNLSGGVTSSYKYVYTTNVNTPPSTSFTSGSSYSKTAVTGDYYLVATACDKAGNCNTKKSNVFKLDNTKPSQPTVEIVTSDWAAIDTNNWYNVSVFVTGSTNPNAAHPTSTDSNSGIAKYQISSNNSTWEDWNYHWDLPIYGISSDGTFTRYIRAVDKAGNISEVTTKQIKVDKTRPTINSTTVGLCSSNKRTITINASDSTSGIKGYAITTSTSTPSASSFNSITANSWTSDAKSSGTYYVWVIDKAGNISSYNQVTVASCFTPTDICNTKFEDLFGSGKGNISGNFGDYFTNLNPNGSWGQWCTDVNGKCSATSGYEIKCATSKCDEYGIRGLTTIQINNQYGCNFGRYWCSCTGAF